MPEYLMQKGHKEIHYSSFSKTLKSLKTFSFPHASKVHFVDFSWGRNTPNYLFIFMVVLIPFSFTVPISPNLYNF